MKMPSGKTYVAPLRTWDAARTEKNSLSVTFTKGFKAAKKNRFWNSSDRLTRLSVSLFLPSFWTEPPASPPRFCRTPTCSNAAVAAVTKWTGPHLSVPLSLHSHIHAHNPWSHARPYARAHKRARFAFSPINTHLMFI